MRSSDGPVFSGSNCVDVLYRHMQLHPELVPTVGEFGRSNCARLCQRFLDLRVFFPAKEKSQALKIIFEDSNFVFYRFNYKNDYLGKSPLILFHLQERKILKIYIIFIISKKNFLSNIGETAGCIIFDASSARGVKTN